MFFPEWGLRLSRVASGKITMARNTDSIDYRKDYYTGPAGIYFNKVMRTIIQIGNLQEEKGLILDYGCGVGHLKRKLPDQNVVGYDIIPELSDVSNYKNLKPAKIVLSGVLEHLYLSEIENLLIDFLGMNMESELLVFLPTENLVSRLAIFLTGQKHAHDDHITRCGDINRLIEQRYRIAARRYVFFRMAQITKYSALPNRYSDSIAERIESPVAG